MSATLDVSLKVLYVQGPAAEADRAAIDQLRRASAELQITTIAGSAAALAELRRTPGWQALLVSSSLPQNEVLALVASLRRDRIPIAIVPILDDTHQDLFASAVATGADDVLVRRGDTLVNINETLTRIRQSPHLFPAEQRRRIAVLYAGRDPLVWNLLDQVPFVRAGRVTTGIDGTCSVRRPGAGDDSLRADAVIIDEAPGDAHPLQVLKSVKAQASDLPVIVLTSAGAADIATAALELGADDTVLKTGIFRRRLIATLRRVHQRLELSAQQHETRTREERLRQIVEHVPTGIMVVAGDARVLAMNAAALQVFGASKPRDVVGRDFRDLVHGPDREAVTTLIRQVTKGDAAGLTFDALTLDGQQAAARIDAVMLERDARGGRGIVASIARAVAPHVETGADGPSAEELATLRDALQTLERHYAELEDARARERAAWDTERQDLGARLETAERMAAERQTLQDRLDEVTAELARTSQAFTAERLSLERRLVELEDAAREAAAAGASQADLETALAAVREEQRQAIAAHALERTGWQDIRTELEARVRQLDDLHQTEHDTLVASLRTEVQRLEQTLADEQVRWTATHDQLDAELRHAREALWAEHTERDTARAAFDAQVAELRTTLDTERAEWQEQRAALEHERQSLIDHGTELGGLAEERHRLAAEFDAARAAWTAERDAITADLAAARAAQETGAADRDHLQADLTQQLHDAHAALEAERRDWQATQQTLDDARRQIEAALVHERAEWQEQRTAFEHERQSLIDHGTELGGLAEERHRLAAEFGAARAAWTAERDAIAADLAAARAAQETGAADRDRLQADLTQQLHDARAALEAERRDWQATERTLDEARRQIEAALAHERTEWQAQRTAFEHERQSLIEQSAELGGLAEERHRLAAEFEAARTAWTAERDAITADLAATREQVERIDEALRALTDEYDATRARLEQERDDARTGAEAIRDRLTTTETELVQARASVRDDREAWEARLAALETALADASAAATAHTEQEATWQQERASLIQSAVETRTAADQERGHLVSLHTRESEEWRQAVDQARAERDHAIDRLSLLETALEATRAQLTDIDELRAALATTHAERQAASERAQAAEILLDTERTRVETIAAERDEAKRLLDDADSLRETLDTARHEHDRALQQIAALEADLADARRQIDGLADAHRALAAIEAAHDRLTARAHMLDTNLADAHRRIAELEPLQTALDTARQDGAQLQGRLAHLEQDLETARATIAEHEILGEALEATRNELRHTDATHHAERDAWRQRQETLERDLRDLDTRYRVDRQAWADLRAGLEAELTDASRLIREQQFLTSTIGSLQSECAALSGALAGERADQDRLRDELDTVRAALAESEAHRDAIEAEIARVSREADERLTNAAAHHTARARALEEARHQLETQLAITLDEAERLQARLTADAARTANAQARLVAAEAFGYAVTTMDGELLRCNDAFARMFGYLDAADARTRTARQSFPPLARRPEISARLAAEGQVTRVASCVERVDGHAVRIIETATVLHDDDQPCVEHIIVAGPSGPTADELQRRRLEEVGTLAASMVAELEPLAAAAHDCSVELAQQAGRRNFLTAETADLRAATVRLAALVSQLARFSRRQQRDAAPLDLGRLVREAEPMLARLAGPYVGFTMDIGPTTPLEAHTDDVQQLLTSLVTSCRDLLPAGGTIAFSVRQDARDVPGPLVSATASGYGVLAPGALPTLDVVAARCGGQFAIRREAGHAVTLDVMFPRCGTR